MKFYDISLIIIISILMASTLAAAISYKVLGPNSPITIDAEKVVEKEAETLIQKETGIDIPIVQELNAPTPVSQPILLK